MKARIFVAVAGLPRRIADRFAQRLVSGHRNLRVLAAPPIRSEAYSTEYLDQLYARVAKGLKKAPEAVPRKRWNLNFVILYLDKDSAPLRERFGLEALLAPIDPEGILTNAESNFQVNKSVNKLSSRSKRLLSDARKIFSFLTTEVTGRENRTCTLLPQANFGNGFEIVSEWAQTTVVNGSDDECLRAELNQLEAQLEKDKVGYFRGSGGLVYRAPAKSGPRHGMAPDWEGGNHTDRCVIRGHLRFGTPFEPNFHYDCDLKKGSARSFTSCHEEKTLRRGRLHANIAPNDNIR